MAQALKSSNAERRYRATLKAQEQHDAEQRNLRIVRSARPLTATEAILHQTDEDAEEFGQAHGFVQEGESEKPWLSSKSAMSYKRDRRLDIAEGGSAQIKDAFIDALDARLNMPTVWHSVHSPKVPFDQAWSVLEAWQAAGGLHIACITLVAIDGLTQREAAAQLGVSLGSVNGYLDKGLKYLWTQTGGCLPPDLHTYYAKTYHHKTVKMSNKKGSSRS